MPFLEEDVLNEEDIPIPQIGTDLFENLTDDEEPLDSGPVIPDILLESLETVEASVVRLDDEPSNGAAHNDDVDESDESDDEDDEDIPTASMEELAEDSVGPKKRGRDSLATAARKAMPKAKEGASAGRKRKADDTAGEAPAKRPTRGRSTAAAASSATQQELAKRPRAPNGQAKAAPKKATGAKRGPKPKVAKSQEEFEVESIDDHMVNGKTVMFYVKWKGYPAEENTWEPKSNLAHAAELLNKYEATSKEKAVPASKKAAAPKRTTPQEQKPAPKPKKVAAKKAASKPAAKRTGRAAGRPAGRCGRPARH